MFLQWSLVNKNRRVRCKRSARVLAPARLMSTVRGNCKRSTTETVESRIDCWRAWRLMPAAAAAAVNAKKALAAHTTL